ncbi:LolA family protein [Candidatus Pelagibacter communis]|mgnify:CR=1 FL=1|uniref:LolA family protein n=1 Tax=Pelagibacter ubique TaxID=198252 RepID=UPI00094D8B3F|nr:outer-membrane lipoprotein carrier protein LolA [Candidatus Pelagibacter ubique]|tara:strand:- start:931 stop:1482 length:552 start_codon:yes stop_codon:yes gene_type:complete
MKRFFLLLIIINFPNLGLAAIKDKIINNLNSIENLSFKFEQNINGKIETGDCVIQYPKKIFCRYDKLNNKILVSNGTSLVIKTNNGNYYRYRIERTPLNYILDKNFLIQEIQNLKERVVDNKFVNFTFFKNENEINIFFDAQNYELIGWQTLDIYQNLNITYLYTIRKNQILEKNFFKLPPIN